MSTEPEHYGLDDPIVARDKTNIPAILLIIVGILNLLLAAWVLHDAILVSRMDAAEYQATIDLSMDAMKKAFPNAEMPEIKQEAMATVYYIWGGGAVLFALVILLGGVRMFALKSYGLAVTAAVLACLPICSCTGCCGFGEVAGIWAFIVLMNPDVRAAFR
jgi:hypothetical protein